MAHNNCADSIFHSLTEMSL